MNNNNYTRIRVAIIVMIIFGVFGVSGCDKSQQKTQDTTVHVNAVQINPQSVPVYYSFVGYTKAIYSVDIRARVKGFLEKRNFTEGSIVNEGDLLYVIDPKPFKADVDKAIANLESSKANAIYYNREALRMKQLYKTRTVSKAYYEKALAQASQAEASVSANQATLETSVLNLSYTTMYSPITGKIGQTQIDVGNYVGAADSTVLATVVQLNPIYAIFSPSEKYLPELFEKLNKGPLDAYITMGTTSDTKFNGKVNFVDNQMDQSTSTVLLRATIENPNRILIPGMYVQVYVYMGDNNNALLVPQQAIQEGQGNKYVYIVQNDKAVNKKVRVGRTYGSLQEIKSGISAGDVVIITGLQRLQGGATVKVGMTTSSKFESSNSSQDPPS